MSLLFEVPLDRREFPACRLQLLLQRLQVLLMRLQVTVPGLDQLVEPRFFKMKGPDFAFVGRRGGLQCLF